MSRKLLTAGVIGAIALGLVIKGGTHARAVGLNPRDPQNCNVRVAVVTCGRLSSEVVASGTVVCDERDVAFVKAQANGFVEGIGLHAAPDRVHEGDVLAYLYVTRLVRGSDGAPGRSGSQVSGVLRPRRRRGPTPAAHGHARGSDPGA